MLRLINSLILHVHLFFLTVVTVLTIDILLCFNFTSTIPLQGYCTIGRDANLSVSTPSLHKSLHKFSAQNRIIASELENLWNDGVKTTGNPDEYEPFYTG